MLTFPEDDIAHVAVGVDRLLLHGTEGAPVWDLLELSVGQRETEECGDLTDAFTQVLHSKEREKYLKLKALATGRPRCLHDRSMHLFEILVRYHHDVGIIHLFLPG